MDLQLRVVELADRRNQYCGKLYSDCGAEVIQIEPLTANPARLVPPFLGDVADPERSLDYWYYNTGKRSVALDLTRPAGRQIAAELAVRADVFLESRPASELGAWGLDYATLSRQAPGLIQASITDFGQSGPWAELLANDEVHLALGGQMAASGYTSLTAPPMGGKGGQSYHIAGILTAQALLAALFERLSSGEGQYLDCSIHDCCSVCVEGSHAMWVNQGAIPYRHTAEHASPAPNVPEMPACADGRYVNTIMTELTHYMWINLVAWMEELGVAGELSDPKYLDDQYRMMAMRAEPEIRAGIARLLQALPAEVVAREAQERCRLAWTVIRAPEENLGDPHWAARDFFVPIVYPDAPQPVQYPRGPFQGTELAFRPRGRAPARGEHTAEVLKAVLGYGDGDLVKLRDEGTIR